MSDMHDEDRIEHEGVSIPDLEAIQIRLKRFDAPDDPDNLADDDGQDDLECPAMLRVTWDVNDEGYVLELIGLALHIDTPGNPHEWFVTLNDEQALKLRDALNEYLDQYEYGEDDEPPDSP